MPKNDDARPLAGRIRSDDEHADILLFHKQRIEKQQHRVAEARLPVTEAQAELKTEREFLTKLFNEAKVDLGAGYTREYLESLVKDGAAKARDLVAIEMRRARDKVLLGQPVFGQQPDLFPGEETPHAIRDEMEYEAEGYLRGLRGDITELQPEDPPAFHQAVMRGYEKGQAETQQRVQRAMEAKQREGQPSGTAPIELNPPTIAEERAEADAKVRRAKAALGAAPANKVPA